MKQFIFFLFATIIISTGISSCQTAPKKKPATEQAPVFDLPYLSTLSKGALKSQLGKPKYEIRDQNYVNDKPGNGRVETSALERVVYIESGYRVEFYYADERPEKPVKVFFCLETAEIPDAAGFSRLRMAGQLNDSLRIGSGVTIQQGLNGFTLENSFKP